MLVNSLWLNAQELDGDGSLQRLVPLAGTAASGASSSGVVLYRNIGLQGASALAVSGRVTPVTRRPMQAIPATASVKHVRARVSAIRGLSASSYVLTTAVIWPSWNIELSARAAVRVTAALYPFTLISATVTCGASLVNGGLRRVRVLQSSGRSDTVVATAALLRTGLEYGAVTAGARAYAVPDWKKGSVQYRGLAADVRAGAVSRARIDPHKYLAASGRSHTTSHTYGMARAVMMRGGLTLSLVHARVPAPITLISLYPKAVLLRATAAAALYRSAFLASAGLARAHASAAVTAIRRLAIDALFEIKTVAVGVGALVRMKARARSVATGTAVASRAWKGYAVGTIAVSGIAEPTIAMKLAATGRAYASALAGVMVDHAVKLAGTGLSRLIARPYVPTYPVEVAAEPFFTGDGVTRKARLKDNGIPLAPYTNPTVTAMHQTDWQGRVELSDQPRTNILLHSHVPSNMGSWTPIDVSVNEDVARASGPYPYYTVVNDDGAAEPWLNIVAHGFTSATDVHVVATFALRAGTASECALQPWFAGGSPANIASFSIDGKGTGSLTNNGNGQVLRVNGLSAETDTVVMIRYKPDATNGSPEVRLQPGVGQPMESVGCAWAMMVPDESLATSSVPSLLSGGTPGAWYDMTHIDGLFQDAAGTTPVTALGQPIGKIRDSSGNGNHATQPVDASRPTLSVDAPDRLVNAGSAMQSIVAHNRAFGELWINTPHGHYLSQVRGTDFGLPLCGATDVVVSALVTDAATRNALAAYFATSPVWAVFRTDTDSQYLSATHYAATYVGANGVVWNRTTGGPDTLSAHGLTLPAVMVLDATYIGDTALTRFYCYGNQLTGSIPDLSALTALTYFYCYGNQLTGSIPDLSALTALTRFNCGGNQLTGSIPDLSALTALAYFQCYTNQLSGSIPDLSALTALKYFHCGVNQLSGSIPDLSALTALTYFDCGGNQLSGSIPDLSALTALTRFYCYGNQLTGVNPGFGVAPSVTDFDARYCALSQSAVDAILNAFVSAASLNGTLSLDGGTNAPPSATGNADKATLISRGWSVGTN